MNNTNFIIRNDLSAAPGDEFCGICLTEEGKSGHLACSMRFCRECLEESIRQLGNSCPQCRQPMIAKPIERLQHVATDEIPEITLEDPNATTTASNIGMRVLIRAEPTEWDD